MTTEASSPYSSAAAQESVNSVNATLAKLSGGSLKTAELFRDRKDGKSYIEKPPTMSIEDVVMQGSKIIEAEAKMVEFTKQFMARPNDGAVAFAEVISQTYGFGAIGMAQHHPFLGKVLPTYTPVTIGYKADGTPETVNVPWGTMRFEPLRATFELQYSMHQDYGICFTVSVTAPKKMQESINGLFMLVGEYLSRNSIYRGKALYGVGRAERHGIVEPEFENPYKTDRNLIVYAKDVWSKLKKNVLTRIVHTDKCRQEGIKIGAKILLYGENGTGKTEFCKIASQYCLEQGWGVIRSRYDEDIAKVIAFGERLGTPMMIILEDVNNLMEGGDEKAAKQRMNQLLDLFDGAGSKGREVMLLMTSNHIDELTRSMTRAGRIDRMIPVGSLDREAVEGLVKVHVPAERREDLEFEKLHVAYDGYAPVWIVESLLGLKLSALSRTEEIGSKFATEDFVSEAEELRPAWEHHKSSTDKPEKRPFDSALKELVGEVLESRRVSMDEDGAIVRVM